MSAALRITTSLTSRCRVPWCLAAKALVFTRLVRRTCDHLLRIPMAGAIASLNVSVAGAVVLFEAARQRRSAAALMQQAAAPAAPAKPKKQKGLGSL